MSREKRFRKPHKGALHIRQVPELGDAARGWLGAHGRGWDYYGIRLGMEGLINALLTDFLGRSLEDQTAILARAIPYVEAMERRWNEEMTKLVDRGEYEVDAKGELVKHEPAPAPSAPVGLEQTGPDGPSVVLDDTNGPHKPVTGRHRPKRRA
jgi:hypothetical protein